MPAPVTGAALATPSPASSAVPRWPMIAESASRKRGSAMSAETAGPQGGGSRDAGHRCWGRRGAGAGRPGAVGSLIRGFSGCRRAGSRGGGRRGGERGGRRAGQVLQSLTAGEAGQAAGGPRRRRLTHSGSWRAWSRSAQPIALRLKKSGSSMFGSMTSVEQWVSSGRARRPGRGSRPPHPQRFVGRPLPHPQALASGWASTCRARGAWRCRRRRPTRHRREPVSDTTAWHRCRPTRDRCGAAAMAMAAYHSSR